MWPLLEQMQSTSLLVIFTYAVIQNIIQNNPEFDVNVTVGELPIMATILLLSMMVFFTTTLISIWVI